MSTTTTTFPFTEDEALKTQSGSFPTGVDPEKYEELLVTIKEDGLQELTPQERDTIKRVIEHQRSVSNNCSQPAQEAPSDVQPGKETVEIEKGSQNPPEASTGKSDSVAQANASTSDANGSNGDQQNGNETLSWQQANKLFQEGKELPSGWAVSSKDCPIPPGWKEDSLGNIVPGENAAFGEGFRQGEYRTSFGFWVPGSPPTKKSLKEDVEKTKDKLKKAKALLKELKRRKNAEAVTKQEAEVAKLEEELGVYTAAMLALPPEVSPDEDAPWYGKIYANTIGYLVKNSEGDYQFTNETNTGRVLREMGISNRPDTPTTSPLDRVFNILHDRHHVDTYLALAGHPPGLLDLPGKKVLITKGPRLIRPAKGEWPIIEEFLAGLVRKQANYLHSWAHLAVTALYNQQITRGLALILAGPINSGKSVCQNHIITPMLGGRVARPYAYMVGDTTFNGDWFESEHLMLEDETPPNNYDKQQRIAAGIKTLVANEIQWCHGKGDKAVTLTPYWRISVSVNNNPANLRAIPANDETLDDKLLILEVYPDATVKLVEKLGAQEAFRNKLREELPAYVYWLRHEFKIPEELKDTRFGMKPFRHPNIVKAVKEAAPYVHLLEYMRAKLYQGVEGLFKSTSEIHQDLKDAGAPSGLAPTSTHILGEYLTSISGMGTGEVTPKRTSKANGYVLSFAAADPEP